MLNVSASEAEKIMLMRLETLLQISAAIKNDPVQIPINLLQHLRTAATRLAEAAESAGG